MEINIREFLLLMVRRIPFLILGALVGLMAFFGYTKMTEVTKYSCEITMIVNAAPETSATLGTINASQELAKAYIAIMKDVSFAQKVEARLPQITDYTPDQIRRTLAMDTRDDSQILVVRVTTPSAQDSYNIAKVIEEIAPTTLRQYFDDTGAIVMLRNAQKPTTANASNVKINSFLGAIVGLVIAGVIVFLVAKLDKRIRSEEDIASVTKYPVLGVISRVE